MQAEKVVYIEGVCCNFLGRHLPPLDILSSHAHHFTLEPYDKTSLAILCGPLDQHLRQIEQRFEVDIRNRGNLFLINGPFQAVNKVSALLAELYHEASITHEEILPQTLHLEMIQRFHSAEIETVSTEGSLVSQELSPYTFPKPVQSNQSFYGETCMLKEPIQKSGIALKPLEEMRGYAGCVVTTPKLIIKPRTATQIAFVEKMRSYDINFGAGPAGTGKTYLAVACAVEALERGEVSRILLVRPAVEAGEKLGFLPGDLSAKVNPYLRPLYDALYEMLGFEVVQKYIERQVIEIAPLAYMRGRTLNHSFIILDESQNTTKDQMKMFLTRLGFGSRAVITGDETQVDLPRGILSGLRHALNVLQNIDDIGFTRFLSQDIVRHSLVQKIVEAYEYQEEETNTYQNWGKTSAFKPHTRKKNSHEASSTDV